MEMWMTQSSEELIGQFVFSLKLLFEKDTGYAHSVWDHVCVQVSVFVYIWASVLCVDE